MESEDARPSIPDYVDIIRDVSNDPAYKNRALAERVINEPLQER